MRRPEPVKAWAVEVLGATEPAIRACLAAPTFEAACAQLEELKASAKRIYRQHALDLHPDRTGGDPEKAIRFRELAAAWKAVEKLTMAVRKIERRPPPFVVRIVRTPSATTSTSTSGSFYSATRAW